MAFIRSLNTLFLMMDANFRLKQKAKGIEHDPDLSEGLAYFVEDKKYKTFIERRTEEREVRSNEWSRIKYA